MTVDHLTELTACPLCENTLVIQANITTKDTFDVDCSECGTFSITEDCMIFTDMHSRLKQRAAKLSQLVRKVNSEGKKWPVITTKMI